MLAEEVVQQQQQQMDISLGSEQLAERCSAERITGKQGTALLRVRAQRASSAAETCCFTKKGWRREEMDSTAGGAADRTALTKLLEWRW